MQIVDLPKDWPTDLVQGFRKWEKRFWGMSEALNRDCEFDYVDNLRVARVGNEKEETEYQNSEYTGCCGSHEEIVTFARMGEKDVKIKYGFNHGH